MTDRVLKDFGKILSNRRKAKGWSQQRLADAAGLPRSYISDLERGLKNSSLMTIAKLAVALETSADELFKTSPSELKRSPVDRGKLLARIAQIVRTGSEKQIGRLAMIVDGLFS